MLSLAFESMLRKSQDNNQQQWPEDLHNLDEWYVPLLYVLQFEERR